GRGRSVHGRSRVLPGQGRPRGRSEPEESDDPPPERRFPPGLGAAQSTRAPRVLRRRARAPAEGPQRVRDEPQRRAVDSARLPADLHFPRPEPELTPPTAAARASLDSGG